MTNKSKRVESVVSAFMAGKQKQITNTRSDGASLFLFGNKIAERMIAGYAISDGGYPLSKTTKQRLGCLPGVKITTRAGINYLNGGVWTGKRAIVNSRGGWIYSNI